MYIYMNMEHIQHLVPCVWMCTYVSYKQFSADGAWGGGGVWTAWADGVRVLGGMTGGPSGGLGLAK